MPRAPRHVLILSLLILPAAVGCREVVVEYEATAVTRVEVLVDEALYAIHDIQHTGSGEILVLTGGTPFLYTVDPTDGVTRASLIRSGQGPGDFVNPWAFVRGRAEGGAAVWDVGASRIASMDSTARWTQLRQFRIPGSGAIRNDIRESTFGDPLRLGQLGHRLVFAVYPRGVNHQTDFADGVLITFDTLTAEMDTLVAFTRSAVASGEPTRPLALAPSRSGMSAPAVR